MNTINRGCLLLVSVKMLPMKQNASRFRSEHDRFLCGSLMAVVLKREKKSLFLNPPQSTLGRKVQSAPLPDTRVHICSTAWLWLTGQIRVYVTPPPQERDQGFVLVLHHSGETYYSTIHTLNTSWLHLQQLNTVYIVGSTPLTPTFAMKLKGKTVRFPFQLLVK